MAKNKQIIKLIKTVPARVPIDYYYFFFFFLLLLFYLPDLPFYIYLSTSFIISNTSSPNTLDNPKSITFKGLSSASVKNKKFSGFKSLWQILLL